MKRYEFTKEELAKKMEEITKAVKEGQKAFTIAHFTRRAQICEVAYSYGLKARGLTGRNAYLIITER